MRRGTARRAKEHLDLLRAQRNTKLAQAARLAAEKRQQDFEAGRPDLIFAVQELRDVLAASLGVAARPRNA